MAAPHPSRSRAQRWPAMLAAALCGMAAPPAAGQEAAPPGAPAGLDEAALRQIDDLDAPDAQARIDATHALMSRRDLPLPVLENALREMPLTAEQRQRLRTVARHHFVTGERGALGVSWQPGPNNVGPVTLSRVLPGFPAEQVLRVGDRIEAIDGTRLFDSERMRAIIVSRDPGDRLAIDLVRDGERMEVEVELGRFGDLNTVAMLPDVLPDAWLARSARYAPGAGTPLIDPGLPAAAWSPPEEAASGPGAGAGPGERAVVVARPGPDWTRVPPPDEAVEIVAGGEARGVLEPAGLFGNRALEMGQQEVVVIQRPDGVEVRLGQDPAAIRNQMLIQAVRERAALMEQRADVERALADLPNMSPEQRQSVTSHLRALERELLVLDGRIRALQQARRRP